MDSKNIIESIFALNGIDTLENIAKDFYYDETNNYRKVHIRDAKLNFEGDGDFVLGGVVVDKNIKYDFTNLHKHIRLDKSANEMKFKHIAQGDFFKVIASKKLKTVLEFIVNNNISIHLQRLNIFYWSIIDIIESVMPELSQEMTLNHMYIKDSLYRILIANKDEALKIFNEFLYPNVESEKLSLFYNKLIDIVKDNIDSNNIIDFILLKVLEIGSKQEEAVFIQNEERGILLDDFSTFYRYRALMFPNSYHYFDNEILIEKTLSNFDNTFNGKKLDNFSFVDSQQANMIQLADVTVGYFARLFNFCKGKSSQELNAIRKKLGKNELEVLKLSKIIIDSSDKENTAYFHSIIPSSDGATWTHLAY